MDECLPRPNNLPPISIRKSAFGRTNLFLTSTNMIFKEVKCSAPTMARQATASVYHVHNTNAMEDAEEMTEAKKKDIVCWHCCHSFDTEGFRLPRSYDPSERLYHVYGWFCSANCCKAYILEHSNFDRGYQMNVFVRMLREVYGIQSGIVEAPPRISLKMFGGHFDIEDFRKQKNVCQIVHPPFVSYCMLVEERQPIESIGESVNYAAARGSVKGLRRPDPSSVKLIEDDFGTPSGEGLYSSFLKTKSEHEDATPAAKKQKITRGKAKQSDRGLERFMST